MGRKLGRVAAVVGVALAAAVLGACSKEAPSPASALPAVSASSVSIEAAQSAPASAVASAAASDAALPAPKASPPPPCDPAAEVTVFASPESPWSGAPLRVMVVSDKPIAGELALTSPSGEKVAATKEVHGGPPYWFYAEVPAPAPGKYKVSLGGGCKAAAKELAVEDRAPKPPQPTWSAAWPIKNAWGPALEDLYAAWIEKLFDAPLDEQPTWAALHEVLRDKGRNFLFDHLGVKEDQSGFVVRPDCADLPYFLRAYFAFKMGLPFGYSQCSRGGGGQPPSCPGWSSSADPAASKRAGVAASFAHFVRYTLADAVHSGSGRAPATDDATDYYPVALTAESLRPGTIYADPYGHVLVLARRIAQTKDAGGMFLAVDGQPDGTVARKRFWRGNFLFAQDPALGSPGFKRFRPVVRDKNGTYRRLTNAEIKESRAYGDFSLDQYAGGVEGFYDKMDDVMSPAPLDPLRAMKETIGALEEQVKTRVQSVDNGRKFLASGKTADMPDGPTIFETIGAWEDFSTPSRDLRLLIAIDVVKGFPDRVARRPERYAMPPGKSVAAVKAELEQALEEELKGRSFSYTRSDGSTFSLTLRDVLDRAEAYEIAYDPNDCVELRWGAPAGGDEMATCKRHAPWGQTAKMKQYRAWFHERRRPARR